MATADPSSTTAAGLPAGIRARLRAYVPFQQMRPEHLDAFVDKAAARRHPAGTVILSPAHGVVSHLLVLLEGHVTGLGADQDGGTRFSFEPGDLFPVGAIMESRAVSSTYTAHDDVVCLHLPAAEVQALCAASTVFAAFMRDRVHQQLALSRQAMQASYATQALAEQSLETPLGQLALKPPVGVLPKTPLAQALQTMHDDKIGSMLVVDPAGAALGILTRHDILDRVVLARTPLESPIGTVMTAPIHTLTTQNTAQDAALLMSRHGIRHVPVTQDGTVVGVVSERDLFAMQRMSIRHVSAAIRGARDEAALVQSAQKIRTFARHLIGQGVAARQLTQLISHLNDLLTERLVEMQARLHGVDMRQACWLAFGSEGRSEQTISTDQDNGLVFLSEQPDVDRPRWLAFGRSVNEALDRCGYPLCKGNIMASNPQCCLTPQEWARRFDDWMEFGSPQDLLNANIYFDLRPLVGRADLAEQLRDGITRQAAALPRFAKQMADNARRHRVPLNWRGAIDTQSVDGREMVDLKHHGTAVFVDVARLYALALGVTAIGTRERFEAIGPRLHMSAPDSEAWIAAFEFLQMLRLQVQMGDTPLETANQVELESLNHIDRHMLKESFRVARRLLAKLERDYPS
ncbi:MAG: CBS domain-containing protein [Rhodoferax sp.]|nr:CBS domain-containing protein [Rhodoferax sp.]